MISKYGPPLFRAVGPEEASFLIVKKSYLNKKYSSHCESTSSTKQKVQVVNIISFAMCKFIHMHTSVCASVQVKYTTQNVNYAWAWGTSFQKITHHFLLHGSLWPTNLEKNLKLCIYIQNSNNYKHYRWELSFIILFISYMYILMGLNF